ncbi:MAG TPA: tripartite tricarboxylate transporter substrate-binding protein, partial [Burkholderiales bacterium]|nr:tripartite tricarboxylate transporter substrate-binding protein [Burkholderiales bacterium]
VVAPAKTPPAIVTLLNRDFVRALHEPDVQEKLAAQSVEVVGSTPQAFSQFIRSEIPKWAEAVRISGARVD